MNTPQLKDLATLLEKFAEYYSLTERAIERCHLAAEAWAMDEDAGGIFMRRIVECGLEATHTHRSW